MTTIAYCKGQMASDSCVTHGNVRTGSVCKIQRLSSGALLGTAGDVEYRDLIPMLDKVRTIARMPTKKELASLRMNVDALWVSKTGKPVYISIHELGNAYDHYHAEVCELNIGGIAAIGSGADFAMGAMSAGRSAREAVAIACKWDIYSKLPVHVLKL